MIRTVRRQAAIAAPGPSRDRRARHTAVTGMIMVVLAALCRPALAGLPDWAAPIVAHPPAVPEGVTPYNFRNLFTETRMAIASDGSSYTRQRRIVQILSPIDRIHVGGFPFSGSAKMKTSKAWHIAPGEKARATDLPPIDVTSQQSFLTDAKTRLLAVRDSRPGSLVVFEFEVTDTIPALGWAVDFYEDVPTAVSRFEVVAPPGWTVHSGWLRHDPVSSTDSGEVKAWELRDLVPAAAEPLGDSPTDRSPLLVVNLEPAKDAPAAGSGIPDWTAMGAWYERLAQGRASATPEVASASRKAATEETAGFYNKVRAEGRFVRDAIRYLDVEIGIGGLQPRPAADTLSNLYGDCKDKATLLVALLASQGIKAYPVLVNATHAATVHATIPAFNAFNHAITAVPIPDATPVPDWAAEAIADGGDLGRLFIIDTTREATSIGAIPSYLAGKQAFVLAGPKARLITLPAGGAVTHRIDRSLTTEVHPDRSLDVSMTARYIGEPAAILRSLDRRSEPDLRKTAERRGLDAWVDAHPKNFSIQAESPDGVAVEQMTWSVPALPANGPEARIPLFLGAAAELPRLSLSGRSTPVELGFPQTVRYETTVQGVPADIPLPDPRTMKGDAWTLTTTYAWEGAALKAVWEMKLSKSRFAPEALPDLKKLYAAVRTTGGESIRLP